MKAIPQNSAKEYRYPIVLKNDAFPNFSLSPNILIRSLTREEKEEYFGIDKIDFIWSSTCEMKFGHVIIHQIYPATNRGRCDYKKAMDIGIYDGTSDVLASNHVLAVTSDYAGIDVLVERINMSFKLLRPTSTGGYFGFKKNDTDVHLHPRYPNPLHGPFDYLSIGKGDLNSLKDIYAALEIRKNDRKLNGALFHFSRALENMPYNRGNQFDLRFILLIVVLDLLFIPDGSSSSNKMASRVSALLDGVPHQTVCKLYAIRNEIIHDGTCHMLNAEKFLELTEIVRKSLRLYLENESAFEKNNLSKIVIVKCPKNRY